MTSQISPDDNPEPVENGDGQAQAAVDTSAMTNQNPHTQTSQRQPLLLTWTVDPKQRRLQAHWAPAQAESQRTAA